MHIHKYVGGKFLFLVAMHHGIRANLKVTRAPVHLPFFGNSPPHFILCHLFLLLLDRSLHKQFISIDVCRVHIGVL